MQQNGEAQSKFAAGSDGVAAHLFELERRNALAHAIVATIREPLIVLDAGLRVVTASGSFFRLFQLEPSLTQGCLFQELNGGRWDGSGLRRLLEDCLTHNIVVEGHRLEVELPGTGRRSMLLNARPVLARDGSPPALLVALEDITTRDEADRLKDQLLLQQKTLLMEIQHRVANSLQIIASILMLKMRAVKSEETRRHLLDAHQRVIAVATVQQQLRESDTVGRIEIAPYLSRLCASLAASMISENRDLRVESMATNDSVSSADAVSLGLIVTELFINALKHGFPNDRTGQIKVQFEGSETGWLLSVSDDGVGRQREEGIRAHTGLGTSIVEALARQLAATVETSDETPGMKVSIIHGD